MRHVIVGLSAAGMAAIEAIRSVDGDSEVVAVSAESAAPYARIFLPDLIAGRVNEEQIALRASGRLDDLGVRLMPARYAVRLDAREKRVALDDGAAIAYDELLIATGAAPAMPSLPGIGLSGVWGLRTLADARGIMQACGRACSAVVVGGGLVGLKAAEALASRGLQVTVVVSSGHVLSQILDRQAAGLIQAAMEERGLRLLLGAGVTKVEGRAGVESVVLNSGERLACGLVVMAKGVAAETGWLAGSGLGASPAGVAIDEHGRTGVPRVWAAGDVVTTSDLVSGKPSAHAIWPEAVEQGRAAGLGMAGHLTPRQPAMSRNIGSFFGVNVVAAGASTVEPDHASGLECQVHSGAGWYRKQVIRDGRLVGLLEVGGKPSGVWQSAIRIGPPRATVGGRRPTYGQVLAAIPPAMAVGAT